jgi:hypothetical protein
VADGIDGYLVSMVRIFLTLSVFAVILLAANAVLGLALGDLGQSTGRYTAAAIQHKALQSSDSATRDEIAAADLQRKQSLDALIVMRQRFRPHIWLGVASALVAVLVNCISVTYFIGTSRWCREVVEAYDLDWSYADRSRRLKRRSFPFAVLGMLTIVGMVALGGAADPGGSVANASRWVMPHAFAGLLGVAVIAAAFYFQGIAVAANFQIIQEIMAETERIRSGGRSMALTARDGKDERDPREAIRPA